MTLKAGAPGDFPTPLGAIEVTKRGDKLDVSWPDDVEIVA